MILGSMPSCAKCHRDLTPGALFCGACGAPVVLEQGEKADPLIGQTFRGVYFIQQKIGSGGMGQVYKAMHVTLDVPIALKVLRKALLSDTSIVQRFHREARAASRLRHPNVIGVTDFGQTEDGTLFMAMEYVAGKSLGRIISEESPLSEQRIVRIVSQILAALGEAHAAQILHRDLKPENVMVESRRDERDVVKVLDFGIAKIQQGEGGGATLTQQGLVCGTPGYMSPEQWGAEALDARSDLYAVGVILYEMLTGSLPFDSQTPMELMKKQLTETPPPPSARRPGGQVSPDLEALVMRTLSSSREERPASAEEMRADLLACVLMPEPEAEEAGGEVRRTVVLPRGASATPGSRPAEPLPEEVAKTLPRVAAGPRTSPAKGTSRPMPALTPARGAIPRAGARATPVGASRATPAAGPRSTPAGGPRATPARAAGRSPTPARQPVPPRHEEDDADDAGLDEAEVAPPRKSRAPLLVAAAGLGVVLVGGGIWAATRGGPDPKPPPVAVAPPVVPISPAPQAQPQQAPPSTQAEPGTPEPKSPTSTEPKAPPAGEAPPAAPPPSARPPVTAPPGPVAQQVVKVPPPRQVAPPARPPVAWPAAPSREPLLVRDHLNSIQVPSESSGDGVLSVQAEPFGDVFLDGRAYGEAPKEFRVSAGVHVVKVVHPKLGAKQAQINVVAGKRVPHVANFQR